MSEPWPRLDRVADLQVLRGEDVALLAIEVVQQRDATGAVRVVLDRRDLGRNAVLVPLEVDDAVLLLVTAAAVARRLAAVVVAAAGAVLGRQQRLLGRRRRDLGEIRDGLEPTAGAGGFAFAECHVRSSQPAWKISISSLPWARVTMACLRSGSLRRCGLRRPRLRLALAVERVDLDDLDAGPDRLDGLADLDLGGVGGDDEGVDVRRR